MAFWMWEMVVIMRLCSLFKISGKHSAQKINHLHVSRAEVTDVSDIDNTLGETFSDNSSLDHCSTSFKSYKQNAEKYSISFTSNNTETYNNSFSIDELTNTISKSHDTAVGLDSIRYQMLKNQILLRILCWVP